MNVKLITLVAIVALLFTACATKRYPIATPMSSSEASLMTCESLEIELIRTEQVEQQINQTGEFDSRTVLGFLGDFGIGNAMAKDEARTALSNRKVTIRDAQNNKGCTSVPKS